MQPTTRPTLTRKVFAHYIHDGAIVTREFDFRRHVERNEFIRFASWATSANIGFFVTTNREVALHTTELLAHA